MKAQRNNNLMLKRNLEEAVIVAARDGNNNKVLFRLVNGEFNQIFTTEEIKALILDAVDTAAFHRQQDSLVILLNKGNTDISGLSRHDMCYPKIASLHEELVQDPYKYHNLYDMYDYSSQMMGNIHPYNYYDSGNGDDSGGYFWNS